jgi:hypothetical protein
MEQQLKTGKLILKYCGENYQDVDQIFTINLIEENGQIPLFEFCFESLHHNFINGVVAS